jgi:hypothetical protein
VSFFLWIRAGPWRVYVVLLGVWVSSPLDSGSDGSSSLVVLLVVLLLMPMSSSFSLSLSSGGSISIGAGVWLVGVGTLFGGSVFEFVGLVGVLLIVSV